MLNRKGQNTAEYAILIALIIAAAVGMQTYVKRGIQGRIQEAVVHTGQNQTVGGTDLTFTGGQFEPDYTNTTTEVKSARTYNESISTRGQVTRQDLEESSKVKAGGVEKVEY